MLFKYSHSLVYITALYFAHLKTLNRFPSPLSGTGAPATISGCLGKQKWCTCQTGAASPSRGRDNNCKRPHFNDLSNTSFQIWIYTAVYANVEKTICLLLFSLQWSILSKATRHYLYLQIAWGSINHRVIYQQRYSVFLPKMSLPRVRQATYTGPLQCQCYFSTFLIMKSMWNSTQMAFIFSWQSTAYTNLHLTV